MRFCNTLLILFALYWTTLIHAQSYAPPAGQTGSTALFKDSSAFVNWAVSCTVHRGFQDISNTALGLVTFGDSSMANGKAMANGIVSLGDGGWAICTFANPIKNDAGNDFAVFENSFDDTFLELAFVEVSSDGVNFFRFPAHSLSDTLNQTGPFGATDATKLNNLAGKYRGGYGTPFDLQELANRPGLNVNAVTHVKIVDVVGSLTKSFAMRDSYGNKINDPWPSPFSSGGFDLDAVGVIHETKITAFHKNTLPEKAIVFPNPVEQNSFINVTQIKEIDQLEIYNASGELVLSKSHTPFIRAQAEKGVYILKIYSGEEIVLRKIVIL